MTTRSPPSGSPLRLARSALGTSPAEAGEESLCRHFGTCGGCALQDLSDEECRTKLRGLVTDALARHGLGDADVSEVAQVAPGTRRRADFKIEKRGGDILIGFHEAKSHAIVDMWECFVLTPAIVGLLPGLRALLASVLRDGEKAQFHVTEADNGFDGVLVLPRKVMPGPGADIARQAARLGFVRLFAGKDILLASEAPRVALGKANVMLPSHAFLQPTREGEALLQERVAALIVGAKEIADLFAGCGTLALPLAERARVHAVEIDKPMADALAQAARATPGLKPLSIEHRDLFKVPLDAAALARFDAVVLDPPRAGALAQARALAQSKVRRIAYVSCDAESFARDAKILVAGGYRMGPVAPVDQFRWSVHIELVAGFERTKK